MEGEKRAGSQEAAAAPAAASFSFDSARGSVLHILFTRPRQTEGSSKPRTALAVVVAIVGTYVPMLVLAALGPLPLLERGDSLSLPFLRDWNTATMFLVSFPTLVAFTVSDQWFFVRALERVQKDGIVRVSPAALAPLAVRWEQLFLRINVTAQVVGLIVGVLLAAANFRAYSPSELGFWISSGGRLLPVGWLFLASIFAFYALIPIYFLRSVAFTVALQSIVGHSRLWMLPAHPDHCGGLRPVGELGLRNQYLLTVLGLNLLSLVAVSALYLDAGEMLYGLIVVAAIAYVVMGPVVFLGPLLPFRGAMLQTKSTLLSEVAVRLRVELSSIRERIGSGIITADDEQLIDRLRKVGSVIDELPVWPFDSKTLRRFITAYVLPLLGAIGYSLLTTSIEVASKSLAE